MIVPKSQGHSGRRIDDKYGGEVRYKREATGREQINNRIEPPVVVRSEPK